MIISDKLSRRELEVLQLLCADKTSREIAAKLFISTRTVGFHVSGIYDKLGVRSRLGLYLAAKRKGLLEDNSGNG